jgi:hypothetical protein
VVSRLARLSCARCIFCTNRVPQDLRLLAAGVQFGVSPTKGERDMTGHKDASSLSAEERTVLRCVADFQFDAHFLDQRPIKGLVSRGLVEADKGFLRLTTRGMQALK